MTNVIPLPDEFTIERHRDHSRPVVKGVTATALTPAQVAKLAETHERYTAEMAAVLGEIRSLESAGKQAQAEDRRSHAAAIAAGKPDPGTPATNAIATQLLELHRRHGALAELVAVDSLNDLTAAIDRHRADWIDTLDATEAELIDQAEQLLAQLDDVGRQIAAGRSTRSWLKGSAGASYRQRVRFNLEAMATELRNWLYPPTELGSVVAAHGGTLVPRNFHSSMMDQRSTADALGVPRPGGKLTPTGGDDAA